MGERRGDRGQQERSSHWKVADLKAWVGFYELGLRVTHVHAHADKCSDAGGEAVTKTCLIQDTLMFLPLINSWRLSEGDSGIIFCLFCDVCTS